MSDLLMKPSAFAVLAALAEGPVAGFGVLERVNRTASGRPVLGPGTLYRLLRELRRSGLIERTVAPASERDVEDDRRTYHRLTRKGTRALEAEAARLRRTMEAAGLLGGEAV